MEKIKAAVIGYGNIGKSALEALLAASDFRVVGIVNNSEISDKIKELENIQIACDVKLLSEKPDVAILCTPTRATPDLVVECLENGINTVDAYDMHSHIIETRTKIDKAAKSAGKASVLAAGWDPGSDSIVRALMEAAAPKGITYTNFGPGMSMGHSVAARAVDGVKNALSMTIPLGTSVHRRMVYVELIDGYDIDKVAASIKSDEYFAHDETHVIQVDSVESVTDSGHGVNMVRKGVSGKTHNQLFEFNMKINNPALTSQLLVAVARAVMRQAPGCYTMIELPLIDMLQGDKEDLIRRLV